MLPGRLAESREAFPRFEREDGRHFLFSRWNDDENPSDVYAVVAFEILPTEDELNARAEGAKGLYRPELASLIAWAKIAIFRQLVTSELVRDPHLDALAVRYFPSALHDRRMAGP